MTTSGFRFIALAALVLAAPGAAILAAAPASAAVQVVRNQDEPARNPYQEFSFLAADCSAALCTINFPAVPANSRVRITNINCQFFMSLPADSNGPGIAAAWLTGDSSIYNFLIAVPQQGSPASLFVNQDVNLYVDAGQAPSVTIDKAAGPLYTSTSCTISGYRVTV